MGSRYLQEQFYAARRDDAFVVLEGFHALKHAVRFGAEIVVACTADDVALMKLVMHHAPESECFFARNVQRIPREIYDCLAPRPPRTGVVAIARRPVYRLCDVWKDEKPVVLIDDARDLSNLGACVRVAAGFGAGGVLAVSTEHSRGGIWKPMCVRASAGLHFALPVVEIVALEDVPREWEVTAFDERGTLLGDVSLPKRSIVVFGSERSGVSDALMKRATRCVRIPMREKVSSLNLATAVAAGLYGQKYE